jgi:hypothetical protein
MSTSGTIPTTPVTIGGRERQLYCSLRACREIKTATEGRIDILARRFVGVAAEHLPVLTAPLLRHAEPEITAEQLEEEMDAREFAPVLRAVWLAFGIDLDALAEQMRERAGAAAGDAEDPLVPAPAPQTAPASP